MFTHLKYPSTDEYIKNVVIHRTEYYSSIKRNEVLMLWHGWTLKRYALWNRLKERTTIVWLHLHKISRIGRFLETESRLEVIRGLGRSGGGIRSYYLMVTKFPFWEMKKFWKYLWQLPNIVNIFNGTELYT